MPHLYGHLITGIQLFLLYFVSTWHVVPGKAFCVKGCRASNTKDSSFPLERNAYGALILKYPERNNCFRKEWRSQQGGRYVSVARQCPGVSGMRRAVRLGPTKTRPSPFLPFFILIIVCSLFRLLRLSLLSAEGRLHPIALQIPLTHRQNGPQFLYTFF